MPERSIQAKAIFLTIPRKKEVLAHIEFMLRVRQRNKGSPVITVTFTVLR